MEIYVAFVYGILFAFLGVNNGLYALIYLIALIGAGLGGYIAILISKVKPPINLFASVGNERPDNNPKTFQETGFEYDSWENKHK